MQNTIDKDISLFFPDEFRLLLLGGNFLFAKRLYEILKRQSKIKRVDYKHEYDSQYFSCINNKIFNIHLESLKKVQALINYYNSDTIILTSEILLLLPDAKYLQFLNLIQEIKKLGVKIVFISIKNPIHVCTNIDGTLELSNMSSKDWYCTRLLEFESIFDSKRDLIYKLSSYCTYTTSNIQINPLDLFHNNVKFNIPPNEASVLFSIDIADEIINDIASNLDSTGTITYKTHQSKDITLSFIQRHSIKQDMYAYISAQSKCSLNLIYRKKPYEIVNKRSVASWRIELGESLKENIPEDILHQLDAIVPIPETGKYYAQGLSHSLNKPYIEAFYKQSEIGRSFDIGDKATRESFINSKLGILPDLIQGKVIGIVDEAIFTGQTLKIVSNLIKNTHVKGVYLIIASPICKNRCKFNMQPDRELLCESVDVANLPHYFGVNGVFFNNIDTFTQILTSSGYDNVCCFS